MDSSSRQSEILEQLNKIRTELARKERKLQKLKRLSAQKRSCDSAESNSVIGVEDSRSSVSLDLRSPLRPIETTLSQSEVCHSKALRTTDSQERSVLLRGANNDALEADENACGRHSRVHRTRTGIGESDPACDAQHGDLQLSRASACESDAFTGLSKPEQRKPPSSDDCRRSNERSLAEASRDEPVQIASRLSPHLASHADSADAATVEASIVPISAECSAVGKELDSATSVNMCKSHHATVLSMTDISSAAVRHGVSHDQSIRLGNVSVQQSEGGSCLAVSLVSGIRGKESSEQSSEAFAYVPEKDVPFSEKRFGLQNDIRLLPTSDGESLHDENVGNSQKEMFEEREERLESQDTVYSTKSRDAATEGSAFESSEMTEPPWQRTETSCSISSKSWSPVRKRRRTTCEVSAPSGPADSKGYNFRQRKLSHSPPVRRRMSRESKSILGAFQKLIQHARELPVSMFELPFEELGLQPRQEVKSASGSEDHVERSRTSFCGTLSSNKRREETDMKVEERSWDDSPSVLETANTSTSFESLCAALSLLPRKKTEATPNATKCDKRETRSSRRQRGATSLSSSSARLESVAQQSFTNSAATRDHCPTRIVSPSSCLVRSACNAADNCGAAVGAVPKVSLDVHGLTSFEVEMSTGAQLVDNQAAAGNSGVPCFGKFSERTEPSVTLTIVREVGNSCEEVTQSPICLCVNREASDQSTNAAADSCVITAVDVQPHATSEMCLQDVNSVCGNSLTNPQEPGDPLHVADVPNCNRIIKQVSTALPHVVYGKEGCSSQELDIDTRQQENSSCIVLSMQRDTRKQVDGPGSECDDGDGVLEPMSPANSNLFTQSEESDCAAGEINDFVTTVVEQLDPQIIIAADREPADQRQDSQGSLSGSATPDNLDLLEGQAQSPDEAPEHPSPEHPSPEHPSSSHEQQGLLAEAARGRFETEEEGPGNLADKAQSAVLRSPSHTSANTSDRPLRIAVLASGTCTPTPGLLGGSEISDGTETVDVRSYCMPPDSSAIKRRTEELTTSCLPGAVSKCIAKKLFANSSACNKALTANSDLPELLDPHELEGMFDEWSEGLDCATRTVNAAGTHECEGESQIPGSHKKHGVGDMSAAAGNCRKSGADHTSVRIMDGELDRAQAADVLSQSLQRRHSELQCNAAAEDDNCENYGQGAEIAQEVECVSPDPVLRSSIEAERKLPSEDQCSQSASSCLGGLSGISRFSDELEEKHAAPHPEDDQKLGCEDLDSPVRSSGGACDGLGEDDHDGAGWDNLDDAYEGQCQGTARPHGSLLGTRNPLLLFCALKCEDEQPVTAVHLVQAAAHPFLVSVQASAINVWHPEEEHGWRHSLVMRRLKFPVEEDHCLLSCEQWTVLVYLNARMPMYLPCLEWRTTDGQDGSQLLLTLGSLGNADGFSLKRSQRIYRIAKLSREGQFATALRTTGGATLLRVHRLRHLRGELGDETDALGRTSNLLDSLVRVEGQPDALLGNSANIFYVWDCNNRVLVKKMIHEPDLFADLQRISWCSSDRGLLFVLMQSSDDVTSTLVAMNPFSCKAEPVISLSWKLAAKVRTGDPRSCSTQVEGRYAACVTPGYGVRIWNLFTGNPVANMWYRGSTSVAIAELSGSMVAAVGLDNGRVLVFTS